jgi:DNA repair exonuclease SbcCD ATPase subunit
MQISHLLLRNFGKFDEFSCDFTPGLNLIKGPNEAGKSTLANAITAALFIAPADGAKKLAKMACWDNGNLPALEAVISVEGRTYRLLKDFKAGKTELENEAAGIKNEAADFVEEWLAEQVGIPSEEIYRATACIAQGEITQIENSFEAIKDKLESLVTGGKEEKAASIVIKKIKKRIEQIDGSDLEGPGELAKLEDQTKEIDYNIEKLSREIASLKARRADLIQVEMAYKNVFEDLGSRKERLEQSVKANKVEESHQKASAELNELEAKISDAQESLKKIKAMRDHQASLKNIDSKDFELIGKLDSGLSYVRPKLSELESDAKEAKEEFESYRVGGFYVACAIIGAIGSAVMGLSYFLEYLYFLSSISFYGILAAAPLFVFGLGIAISRKQHSKYLGERSAKLSAKLNNLSQDYQEQTIALNRLLVKYSSRSIDELKRSIWQFDDLEKQISRERQIYDSILGNRSFKELEARKESLEDLMAQNAKFRKESLQHTMDEGEIARQGQIVNQFEERKRDLEKERAVLVQQIETAEGGAELLAGYVERREQIRAKVEEMEREVKMIQLTAECINEARQNVLVSTLEVLNGKTSDILHRLTSGRYSKVRFDKSTMKFEILSDDKRRWLDPESGLSSGTVDQVYLAARLALAELIAEDKSSVMILDDPFTSYDQKRMENAMKVLKELSENHQILLLTSQDHYDKWADSMIALG